MFAELFPDFMLPRLVLIGCLGMTAAQAGLAPIELTLVDGEAIGYAVFQSHNQKVVANAHGIFMTHLRTRNEAYTAQTWRLSRSTDGGKTFETVYEATHATNPPVLETDAAGTVYLARPDFEDGNAYLYRFLAEKDFQDPIMTVIPGAAAGKYSMSMDAARGQLYFFAHNNTFNVIGLDGQVRTPVTLLQQGPNACLQYPLLSLAADGALHAAWTTQKHGVYLYWDIHHIVSPDGGQSWRAPGGATLTPPIVADDTGPAPRITSDDEFEAHTWLASFLAKGGKLHFAYMAQTTPPRMHYARYDSATGAREVFLESQFRGDTLEVLSLDGFFATRDGSPESPLYFVGSFQGRVVCLASTDNGTTWHDHAAADAVYQPYSVGGCRTVTPDGCIIGSFTDQSGNNTIPDRQSRVYFFRIPAR
ncbi:MAG: hypothetical protein KA184_15620 [Candidatus Hydrogenedentes bacterium]|nr:hypothetical protein [Candidatus Hydrogenedentota bacterium]